MVYADGIDVFNEDGIQYSLGMARGLSAFRPGNYDVAIFAHLVVATPMDYGNLIIKGTNSLTTFISTLPPMAHFFPSTTLRLNRPL